MVYKIVHLTIYKIERLILMIQINEQQKILKKLIKLIELYLIGTLVLYFLGPYPWPTKNLSIFLLFLLMAQGALYLGYNFGIKKKKITLKKKEKEEKVITFIYFIMIINLLVTILNLIYYLDLSSFSFSIIFDQLREGLINPSDQYLEKFEISRVGGRTITYLVTLLSPMAWSSFPLSLYYFKKLNLTFKILCIVTLFLEAAHWIGIGTNKGIFDLAFIIISVLYIKSIRKKIVYKKEVKKKDKGLMIGIIILFLAIVFFINAIGDRLSTINNLQVGGIYADDHTFLMRFCPYSLQRPFTFLTSYLTQGYYALSIALTMVWKPMFGIGNSTFLMANYEKYTGIDLFFNTYQSRMAVYGWHPTRYWHSIYVWLANDVGFIGVVVLMFIIGFYFSLVFKKAVLEEDSISIVLCCLFCIMFFYFPANNQVFSIGNTFMTFWVLTGIWIFKYFKKSKKQ